MRHSIVLLGVSLVSSILVLGQGNAFYEPLNSPPYNEHHVDHMNELIKSLRDETIILKLQSSIDYQSPWKTWATVANYTFGKDRGSLPMIADPNSLHPFFRDKVLELIQICKSKGIELAIVEAYRTHSKQNEYKSMGKKYTRSSGGSSKHQYGLAIDLVPLVDSTAEWHNAALWKKVGVEGEKLGLRWGGRWRHMYDPGHFEWTGGLSSYHLSSGMYPKIPKAIQYPCIKEDLNQLSLHWKEWEVEQSTTASQQVSQSEMK